MKKNRREKSEHLQQVSEEETAVILDALREVLNAGVAGDVVEFGCYRGDTSLLIERVLEREFGFGEGLKCADGGASADDADLADDATANNGRRLWLYDSFEGLPERSNFDASVAGDGFAAGELFVTKREVVERFKKAGLRVPRIRKGFFEDLDAGAFDENGVLIQNTSDLPKKIAFAFLDGDLYQSIKTSLELVTPRMAAGGVILVHDYNNPQLPGVARAVEEWLRGRKNGSAGRSGKMNDAPKLKQRESLAIFGWQK